jgi:Domain of unknown function (DUF4440)
MRTYLLGMILCVFAVINVQAQVAKDSPLFLDLKRQDSVFFERSFNRCDFDYLEKAVHTELVFFHDQGGIQHKSEFLLAVRNNICGNANFKPIRKLKEGSLEVYPLYQDGKLYGAVQSGVHLFYIREPNQKDRLTNIAKFTHVWLVDNGNWILREVLSYDHQEPAQGEK